MNKTEAFARGSLVRIYYSIAKKKFHEAIENGEYQKYSDLGSEVSYWAKECDKADDIWWDETFNKNESKS